MTMRGPETVNSDILPWLPLAPKIGIRVLKLNHENGGFSVMIKADAGGVLMPLRASLGYYIQRLVVLVGKLPTAAWRIPAGK